MLGRPKRRSGSLRTKPWCKDGITENGSSRGKGLRGTKGLGRKRGKGALGDYIQVRCFQWNETGHATSTDEESECGSINALVDGGRNNAEKKRKPRCEKEGGGRKGETKGVTGTFGGRKARSLQGGGHGKVRSCCF